MKNLNIKELTARLDEAHRLTQSERNLLVRDLERYAARDLYGAAMLCRDHMHKEADLRLPAAIQAAPLLAKHFEARMDSQRRAVELYHERDKQLRQPEAGREYVGPVVGTTPKCVVQLDKSTGDLIVHPRSGLVCAFEANNRDKDLSIHYPQAAIGGIGLVKSIEQAPELTNDYAFKKEAVASKNDHGMEQGR